MAEPGRAGSGPAGAPPGDARCPRCGSGFHCGVHDPKPCACRTVHLGAGTLAGLRTRYVGCLCLPCLRELARDSSLAGQR